MAIHNPKDFYSGLLFIAIGLAFAIGAANYPLVVCNIDIHSMI
jgi:hypothetical protein